MATSLKVGMDKRSLDTFKDTIIDKSIDATMVPIRDPKLNVSRANKIFGLFEVVFVPPP